MFTKKRLKLASLAALALMLVSGGVNAVWTDSVSTQTQDLTTGDGSLEITGGSLATSITASVGDMVPGDSVTRNITVHNGANYDLATVALNVTDGSDNLFSSHPEGLQATIERNDSGSWTQIYQGYTVGNLIANIGGEVLDADGTTELRVTQLFLGPDEAQDLKAKQALLTYTFTGTQRDSNAPVVLGAPANLLSNGSYYDANSGPEANIMIALDRPVTPVDTYKAFVDGVEAPVTMVQNYTPGRQLVTVDLTGYGAQTVGIQLQAVKGTNLSPLSDVLTVLVGID